MKFSVIATLHIDGPIIPLVEPDVAWRDLPEINSALESHKHRARQQLDAQMAKAGLKPTDEVWLHYGAHGLPGKPAEFWYQRRYS